MEMNCLDFVATRLHEITSDLHERGSEPREIRMHPDAMSYFSREACKVFGIHGEVPPGGSHIINGIEVVLDEACQYPCVIDTENRRHLL